MTTATPEEYRRALAAGELLSRDDLVAFELEYIARLRALGVKSVSFATSADHRLDIQSVEFFPQEPRPEGGAIVPKSMTQDAPHEEDKCACGHILPAHDGAGLCLLGCDIGKCVRTLDKTTG